MLALVPPLAARFKRHDEVARLRAELADAQLRPEREDPARAIADLEAQRDELRRERDDWRARAEAWRERALVNIPAQQPAGPDFQRAQWAQAQQQIAQQAQIYPQMAQQGPLAAVGMLNQANQMLGAQNLSSLNDMFCNCVPARHDLFVRD